MEPSYDLAKIVSFALRREVMAWRTYEKMSELAGDGPALNMLLRLVDFEIEHVKQFTEVLRPQIDAAGIDVDAVVRAAEEEPLDLGGFVDEKVLATETMSDVLRRALRFEESMAQFYGNAARETADTGVRAILEQLAGEERSHIRFVEDVIASLTMDPAEDEDEFPSL